MHFDLEKKIISAFGFKPYMWLRYIDNIFMVWTHGEAKLREFLDFMNAFHDTIKFTWEWSRDTVSFLEKKKRDNQKKILFVVSYHLGCRILEKS